MYRRQGRKSIRTIQRKTKKLMQRRTMRMMRIKKLSLQIMPGLLQRR
jgi:hypothetical protein